MIPVVPYIETLGTKNYSEFISTQFNLKQITDYFYGWKGKEMGNWYKYTDGKITLEFFPTYYNIKITGNSIKLPLPKTLNDFINDMNRLNIDLFWLEWVEKNFEPKDFLPKNEIKNYYKKLLSDIDKGHEILNTSEDENE